jgi:hypothetical protein
MAIIADATPSSRRFNPPHLGSCPAVNIAHFSK